jgi:hypothetical protein
MKHVRAVVLALTAVVGVAASAQQPTPTAPAPAPSPAEEHVVAPSLPDQPNKEGLVRPSGSMPTDAAGYVRSNVGPVDPSAPTPVPAPGGNASTGGPRTGAVPPGQAPPAARGPAIVRAAYLSVIGTVTFYRKGDSLTVLEKSGYRRTVKLAAGASTYPGLAVGDRVVARIPLSNKPTDGKGGPLVADLVERQKAPSARATSTLEKAESPPR